MILLILLVLLVTLLLLDLPIASSNALLDTTLKILISQHAIHVRLVPTQLKLVALVSVMSHASLVPIQQVVRHPAGSALLDSIRLSLV